MFTLAYSDNCSDSKRLKAVIESVDPLKQRMHVLTDVNKMMELKIEHVPTIIDQTGNQFARHDAFLWVKRQIESAGLDVAQFGLSDIVDPTQKGAKKKTKLIMYLVGMAAVIVAFYIFKKAFGKKGIDVIAESEPVDVVDNESIQL